MAPSSRPRQSGESSRQTREPRPLPVYQLPSHPLNNAAQRALQTLPQTHSLKKLKERLNNANQHLSTCAAEITDRYQRKAASQQRRRARLAQQGLDEDEEGERVIEEMRRGVQKLTDGMEEGIRNIIDARAAVEATEEALSEIHTNIVAGGGAIAPTQSTLGASQFRQRRRRTGGNLDDESDEDEEMSQSQGVENAGPGGLLKRKLQEHEGRYSNLPLRARYATHNDYIGFKKILHDATYPEDDAPPLPNPSTWFPASPRSVNTENEKHRTTRQAAAADDESDLEVASERISIKCPITLLPMQDPVTSNKCPHNFEKSAILDMISRSMARIGGTNRRGVMDGVQAMKCPVCEVMLTASDLYTDPVLVRKIARIQAAQNLQDEGASDSDDDLRPQKIVRGTQRQQAEDIDSGDDVSSRFEKVKRARSEAPRVKAERVASSMVREREREVSVVPGTQVEGDFEDVEEGEGEGDSRPPTSSAVIVDLGEEEGDDEDEDDDEVEE